MQGGIYGFRVQRFINSINPEARKVFMGIIGFVGL